MHISLSDAGNYYRGLLLLIRKDNKVMEEERDLLKRVGKSLGFEKSFCVTAINEILDNQYIADRPPLFSKIEVAQKFIKDGFIVAWCDDELHPDEEKWLRYVAQQNGIDGDWFLRAKEKIERSEEGIDTECDDLVVVNEKGEICQFIPMRSKLSQN
jgi:2-hydroxychromene-2-carboxylate isomerase